MSISIPSLPTNKNPQWTTTPDGDARGYIQPGALRELWFHTGTACNLSCPFCLEGSRPGDSRLQQPTLDELRPYMDEAVKLGVAQFSFTGGEPYVNKDFSNILGYALEHRPALVLTNGTLPIRKRMDEVLALRDKPHDLRFRVSFDYPDAAEHDASRGAGNFDLALQTLQELHAAGFQVSIARLAKKDEDTQAIDRAYTAQFRKAGVPDDTLIVAFPEFLPPNSHPGGVPHITENCMRTYHTEESRAAFMCGFSRMVVKSDGDIRVYACTLVDDDPLYDLGSDLSESMKIRIRLGHHRCFSCFAYGASCSEGKG